MKSRITTVLFLIVFGTATVALAEEEAGYGEEEPAAETPGETGYCEEAPVTPDFTRVSNPAFGEIAQAADKLGMDRRAILAMRGEYRVDFNFQETVRLSAGYDRRDDKVTGGYETVLVVTDTPGEIVLQHILVGPEGMVIKHWRQDWFYEADQRFEFVSDQTWALANIDPALTRGAWTQCVYEVSDAPRYCGTGEWVHEDGVSTWTSDPTWRPLPRREYTIRDDYNAIEAINRHTVTPFGWAHEQDNTKTVRDGAAVTGSLVREFGFNDYQSIEGFEFEPAYEYWDRTQAFWERVRDAWQVRLWSGVRLELTTEVDGMPIIEGTFDLAEKMPDLSEVEQVKAIEDLLGEWTRPVGFPMAARY